MSVRYLVLAFCWLTTCVNGEDNIVEGVRPTKKSTQVLDPKVGEIMRETAKNSIPDSSLGVAYYPGGTQEESALLGTFSWGSFVSNNDTSHHRILADGSLNLSARGFDDSDIQRLCQTQGYEAITRLNLSGNAAITPAAIEALYNSQIGSVRVIPQQNTFGVHVSNVCIALGGTSVKPTDVQRFGGRKTLDVRYIMPKEYPNVYGVYQGGYRTFSFTWD